jgi:hypothetical protein
MIDSSRFVILILEILVIIHLVFCNEDIVASARPDDAAPSIVIHSPQNGHVIPVELHGWDSMMIDVNLTISNFHAQEGSLALFVGNGELLLSEHWQPLNGNRKIRYEIPFPDKDDHRERLDYLTKGHHISFRLEFSLLDAGLFLVLACPFSKAMLTVTEDVLNDATHIRIFFGLRRSVHVKWAIYIRPRGFAIGVQAAVYAKRSNGA